MDLNQQAPPPPPIAPPPVAPWSGPPPPPPPPLQAQTFQQQWGPPPEPSWAQKLKRTLGPVGVFLVVCLKFLGKLKFLILPILKFLPVVLKTGGTMLLSIWLYGKVFGVWFGVGFVLLIFVHECGHLLAAKRLGLKVGAPVFIPFMGALIALKEAPRNAWIEAQVGIGGPLFGAVGAAGCVGLYFLTGNVLYLALAYTGFFLNLFNLAPVGFLDGGRIVTALSPWLWIVGFGIVVIMTVMSPNPVLIFILIFSIPRLISLFRTKTEEQRRYYEVQPWQRWTMGVMYFGLIAALMIGMEMTHLGTNGRTGHREQPQQQEEEQQLESPQPNGGNGERAVSERTDTVAFLTLQGPEGL